MRMWSASRTRRRRVPGKGVQFLETLEETGVPIERSSGLDMMRLRLLALWATTRKAPFGISTVIWQLSWLVAGRPFLLMCDISRSGNDCSHCVESNDRSFSCALAPKINRPRDCNYAS